MEITIVYKCDKEHNNTEIKLNVDLQMRIISFKKKIRKKLNLLATINKFRLNIIKQDEHNKEETLWMENDKALNEYITHDGFKVYVTEFRSRNTKLKEKYEFIPPYPNYR